MIRWLQNFINVSQEPSDIIGTKWLHTKSKLTQNQHNPRANTELISEFDVDAPLRQKKHISHEDETYDRAVHKYIFDLLRADKFKEACAFCDLTGNLSLSIAIRGHYDYFDPEIEGKILGTDPNGSVNKALWRRMCWQLTREQNLDPYERGIYGVLSSDLTSVLTLSDTWEMQLLSYLSSLAASEDEETLFQQGRIDKDIASMKLPKVSFDSSAAALEILSHSRNPEIRMQSEHMCRQFCSAIINDELDLILESTASQIESLLNGDDTEESLQILKSTRIALHLLLFLRQLGKDIGNQETREIIIQSYIQILHSDNRIDLIPLYVSYLSDETALNSYSIVLASIEDSNTRLKHISLAQRYGLDIDNTIRRAVGRVFDENASEYISGSSIEFSYDVTEADEHVCEAAKWYVDNGMWTDCIHTSVTLYRMLLSSGKVQVARGFSKLISISEMIRIFKHSETRSSDIDSPLPYFASVLELEEYKRLMDCLDLIESWNIHYTEIAACSKRDVFKQRPTKAISDLWKRDALSLVGNIADTIKDLCISWMTSVIASEDTYQETLSHILRLRVWYIPFLLMELLRIFMEAQVADPNTLRQAANLAAFVASEDHKLYELLIKSNQLSEFLGTLADACADGVIKGERGIFE